MVPGPAAADVLAHIGFGPGETGLLTCSARVGSRPAALDLDTGDGGTRYLREDTRALLPAGGGAVP